MFKYIKKKLCHWRREITKEKIMKKDKEANKMIKKANGEVPIFVDVDRSIDDVNFSDTGINALLLCGKGSSSKIQELEAHLKGQSISRIDNNDDLDSLYSEFKRIYDGDRPYFDTPLFVIIENLDFFASCDNFQNKLVEMLRKGFSANMIFICGTNGKSIGIKLDINFPIKIDDNYHGSDGVCENKTELFNVIGKIISIKKQIK